MDATFNNVDGSVVQVMTDEERPNRVMLDVDIGPNPSRLLLTKSEARAIASALMGAAAEL